LDGQPETHQGFSPPSTSPEGTHFKLFDSSTSKMFRASHVLFSNGAGKQERKMLQSECYTVVYVIATSIMQRVNGANPFIHWYQGMLPPLFEVYFNKLQTQNIIFTSAFYFSNKKEFCKFIEINNL